MNIIRIFIFGNCQGNILELKNISRQNFIENDLGKNKAEVLARRYSAAFEMDISYLPEYLDSKTLPNLIKTEYSDYTFVIISCVDNNNTRHLIKKSLKSEKCPYSALISAGNHENSGQVLFQPVDLYVYNSLGGRIGESVKDCVVFSEYFKDDVDTFSLNDNDKHPNDLSCAESSLSAPQNIASNILAANIVFNYCNMLLTNSSLFASAFVGGDSFLALYMKAKKARSISGNISYFNTILGNVSINNFADDENLNSYVKNMKDTTSRILIRNHGENYDSLVSQFEITNQ